MRAFRHAIVLLLFAGSAEGVTTQTFDGDPGTPYALPAPGEYGACAVEAETYGVDPFVGAYLRLVDATGIGCNSVTFERTDPGGVAAVTAWFQFRIEPSTAPGVASADGLGFALVDSSFYPPSGRLLGGFEEPELAGSLGIGFDVYQNDGPPLDETDGNHVSIHFPPASWTFPIDEAELDLDGDGWISARVEIDFLGGDVTVTLTRVSDGASFVVVPETAIPGLAPYEGRVHFGARSGGGAADHDLANVFVLYTGDEARFGRWDLVADWPVDDDPGDGEARPLVAIHAHLLPTGKVLLWDRHDHGHRRLRTWDPETGEWGDLGDLMDVVGYDPFCAGHSYLADATLLVSGGHIQDLVGEPHASRYDPFAGEWSALPDLNAGRWYPTSTTLANGDVLVVSGEIDLFSGRNALPQVWDPRAGAWRDLPGAVRELAFYPFMHLAPDGRVFHAGPERQSGYLDPTGAGGWVATGDPVHPTTGAPLLARHGYRDYGSSAMFEPGKILVVGGANYAAPVPTTRSAELIDLGEPEPRWRDTAPMRFRRKYGNATLLPDGTVIATGGTSSAVNDASERVLAAEGWDPDTEEWTLLAGMRTAALYHSNALLLPDGRLLATGGGHPAAAQPAPGETGDYAAGEVYSPPYLFRGPRPEIGALDPLPGEALPRIDYGRTFAIPTADADRIDQVVWIRLGSATHAFNQDQRLVRLAFERAIGRVVATAPADPRIAPPGPYLLFLVDGDGVPSIGRIIRTNLPPEAEDDTLVLDEDEPLPDLEAYVLANDHDAEEPVRFVGAPPAFSPPADWNGTESIEYRITDGLAEDTATLTIAIAPVNDPPVATDDFVRARPGETVRVDLVANDRDVEGALTLVRCDPGAFGTPSCDARTATYTATEQDDFFSYTVRDADGAEATATVSILVSIDSCDGYCCCQVTARPRTPWGAVIAALALVLGGVGALRYRSRATRGTSRSSTVLRPSAPAARTARSHSART